MTDPDDIVKRLRTAWLQVAVCHCGNGIKEGCCDNHNPTWNPCPDSQLLDDAVSRIEILEAEVRAARDAFKKHSGHHNYVGLCQHCIAVDRLQSARAATDAAYGGKFK